MRKWLILLLVLTLMGSGIYCIHQLQYFDEIKAFTSPENLKSTIESFGVFAPIVFIVIYYVLTLLFVSAALFTVLAGLLFGKLWGSIYVIIAATAAAQTAFYVSKNLGSDKVHALKQKKGIGSLIKTLEEKCQKNGLRNFFILRCLFLPYAPLSYAAGMIKTAKARDFFIATLVTNMIFSPAFVFFGDSLLKGPKALILPAVLIVLVLLVPKIVKKFQGEEK